jgi:hypothetical protein
MLLYNDGEFIYKLKLTVQRNVLYHDIEQIIL